MEKKDHPNRSRQQKLIHTEKKLQEMLTFLQDYLPLANVHSNDFILHNIWEKYLSKNIREELETMSAEEVLALPHKVLEYQCELAATDISQAHTEGEPWKFSSAYFDAAPRTGKLRKLHEIRVFPLDWKHGNVDAFVKDATKNTLYCSGLVNSREELESKLRSIDNQSLVIPNFMSPKKSHEVNIMSDICSMIAKQKDIDVIVDMGSGKGYLSTQLVYQHSMCVVGVDAQTINTTGAQHRATLLGKQWDALVKQAEDVEGNRKKIGKKQKKRLKILKMMKNNEEKTEKTEITLKEGRMDSDGNQSDISEDVLHDIQSMLYTDAQPDQNCVYDGVSSLQTDQCDVSDAAESLQAPISPVLDDTLEVETKIKNDITTPVNNKEKNTSDISKTVQPSANTEEGFCCQDDTESLNKGVPSFCFKCGADTNEDQSTQSEGCIKCKQIRNQTGALKETRNLHKHSQNSTENYKHLKNQQQSEFYFPITVYVDDNMDILDLVKQSGACKDSGEITLMLTGLHTCGSLGSSLQNIFVNSKDTKVLCYVGCCYHLMNEEFVMAPFTDGHEDDKPGFPMCRLLRQQEVGLGRAARNFASQTINRVSKQLEAKSYPRSLLQKILYDTVGYVDDGWKGLRKLDQKCNNMYEYVKKAFEKLKLPAHKITPELVSDYCTKYKDEEKKLAVFLQLKSILAPCIESVILFDRYCYLLEQDCIEDVMLVQMFDPVTSPRCHAIIAYKH